MDFHNTNVLVVGLARSGISAIRLLSQLGARVMAYDGKPRETFQEQMSLLDHNVHYYFEEFELDLLNTIDYIIMSPGVPMDLPFLLEAKKRNIPIWSELELAYRFFKGKLVAITGTNGKTTTTTLVGEIMKAFFSKVYVVGNIGLPFSEIVLNTDEETVIVAEVSSFQLESIESFQPSVSSILNITPDHLNRHKTMENYIEAKKRITEYQQKEDVCILNYDDLVVRSMSECIPCSSFYFSRKEELSEGVFLQNQSIVLSIKGRDYSICHLRELQLLGEHNIENIMAAIAISIHIGVPLPLIKKVITSFTGVEHRIEYVATIEDVTYYNDSKATNPDAAIQGIKAMVRPTLLIAGGMDKENEFDDWIMAFDNKVKYLILFGETKHIIEQAAKKYHFENTILVKDLKEAVEKARELAIQGDCVLLSPACASWDMFQSYEERGNLFKKYVVSLGE